MGLVSLISTVLALEKVLLSWSGGKDSSLSYYEIRHIMDREIAGLVTTVTQDYQRISMHGVRRELLRRQADAMRLQLYEVMIPKNASNEIYERQTRKTVLDIVEREKISQVVFGDLFLQDIRKYREKMFGELGISCEFPIWGKGTEELANFFVASGFKAIICCVDPKKIGKEFCGREYDLDLLFDLPVNVDPCGENGEFHTFVYDGPIFRKKIDVKVGEVVEREGIYFADILPV
ncbi:MAG: adenine nucleotide alpha hydrolase [Nitrososphaerota archaeon]|jgi:uncharacterized protein (TIGR00290 family)|nr:adenine nucleotide alpha hydrolase [Nitrososphaerota archaeon]MDG6923207.1 adenine nucleotide alpha hydrolase [Nitrososphaerota archaeon]